jgi:hypothetical protein
MNLRDLTLREFTVPDIHYTNLRDLTLQNIYAT